MWEFGVLGEEAWNIIWSLSIALIISVYGYKRKSLSLSGALMAIVVGFFIVLYQPTLRLGLNMFLPLFFKNYQSSIRCQEKT